MFHAYLDLFLQHLASNLPWMLIAAAGIVGWSPVGRAWARSLRDRGRTLELEESVSRQLAEFEQALADVTERLDLTERRLLQLPGADAAPQRPAAEAAAGEGIMSTASLRGVAPAPERR